MDTNPMAQKARQKMQETPSERSARSSSNFKSVESSMPKLGSTLRIVPFVDTFSSYLGLRNPLATEAHPSKDSVWLLDNTAYRPVHMYPHRQQPWHAEFMVAYFEPHSGKNLSAFVADIADKVGLADMDMSNDEGEKRIAERLLPFTNSIRPAKTVKVILPNGKQKKLGPGGRNGISTQTLGPLREWRDGDVAQTTALKEEITPLGPGITHFAGPEGWLVISDIDDTVKITQTPSPIGILRTTFVLDPEPTAGMPAFYARLSYALSPAWFYLSASPYNLYPFLRSFLHTHYPPGPIVLRDASWMSVAGILTSLTQGTQAYKVARMDKIHMWLPQRRVLCVGDSTQSDPESYAEVYAKYEGWVKAIFIRKVTDVSGMEEKNKDERFEKAFQGVPRSAWKVFEHPDELAQAVEALKTI